MDSLATLLSTRLIEAHRSHVPARWQDLAVPSAEEAYEVQWRTVASLGDVAGWKIGLKADTGVSTHAPLPHSLLMPSGSALAGPRWRTRGVEVEVAVRLARDLSAEDAHASDASLETSIDAMLPVIEIVETRLADWQSAPPLLKLADLQSFGALIIGDPVPPMRAFDPTMIRARLTFDATLVADTIGGNPSGDIWQLLRLLAAQTAHAPRKPRAGDIVTTGSCTGMPFAPAGAKVSGEIAGLGTVRLSFR